MELFSKDKDYILYQGNMLDMLDVIEENSIDSIVTDPPYGLTSITKRFGKKDSAECQYGKDGSFQRLSKGFMGKEWDGSGIEYNIDTWTKCLKVLKEGGYLLAFGGSRTFHRIACAIEDAGFEIRDTIMWLYGSGFPKSMNIGLAIDKKNGVESKVIGKSKSGSTLKAFNLNEQQREAGTGILAGEYELKEAQNKWNGWGTALKPSFEPIIVARKPFKGTLVDNILKNGVGGINIDECRVGTNDNLNGGAYSNNTEFLQNNVYGKYKKMKPEEYRQPIGRFPANTILTYDQITFDEVCGGFPNTKSGVAIRHNSGGNTFGGNNKKPPMEDLGYDDSGSASRYFYCAKASKKDRDEGLDDFEIKSHAEINNRKEDSAGATRQYGGGTNPFLSVSCPRKNTHPTVKPTELMQYLIRLVTPNNGIILDPFNGSGSTGKAVMYENLERNKNYKYIGIELDKEYLDISKARIEYIANKLTD